MRIRVAVSILSVLAIVMFTPVYLVHPILDINSLTAYILGGYIYIVVLIFLSNGSKRPEASQDWNLS